MGPWRHSQVNYDGATLGPLQWDGDTALQFRRDVLKPFFDQHLKDGAPRGETPPVFIYNTGENRWDRFERWPLACATGLRVADEAALPDAPTSACRSTAPEAAAGAGGLRRVRLRSRQARALRAAAGALRRRRRPGATGW